MGLLQKIYDQLFPPIDKKKKVCDTPVNNDIKEPEKPTFQSKTDN